MGYIVEAEQQIPVLAEVDVLVCGGGPAGFGAALGAARAGARTLVVERNSFLGGNATAGLMANLNVTGPHLAGAARELLYRLAERDGAWMGRVVTYAPELMKQAMLEMVSEAGAEPLFYAVTSRPILQGNAVQGAIVETKSGRQAILARTVVDCTGDADLAYRAGAPCAVGRESDQAMRPMSLLFRLGNIDLGQVVAYCRAHPDQFSLSAYANVLQPEAGVLRIEGFYDIMAAARDRGELDKDIHYLRFEGVDVANGTVVVNTVRVYNLDGADGCDLSRAEIEGRRQMMQLVAVIRQHIPGCQRAFLIDSGVNMGVRETRRIVGEHVFTDVEAWNQERFPDSVAHLWRRAGLGSEMHSPDAGEGLRRPDFFARLKDHDPSHIPPPPERDFYFPYRSLIPQGLEGLLVAGRCMSVSHLGDTWTRGIMIVMVCGQAAGTAAALSAQQGVGVRQVDLATLQGSLRGQGVDV